MVSIAAIWSFLVILPLSLIGFRAILRFPQRSLGEPVVPPSIATALVAIAGLVAVIVGIVKFESPLLFYGGMWTILVAEAWWMLADVAPGTNLKSAYRIFLYWAGIALVPVVCSVFVG